MSNNELNKKIIELEKAENVAFAQVRELMSEYQSNNDIKLIKHIDTKHQRKHEEAEAISNELIILRKQISN